VESCIIIKEVCASLFERVKGRDKIPKFINPPFLAEPLAKLNVAQMDGVE